MKQLLTQSLLFLRSLVWYVWTATAIIPLALLLVLSAPLSGWRWLYRIANWWGVWTIYGLKWICHVDWRITGLEQNHFAIQTPIDLGDFGLFSLKPTATLFCLQKRIALDSIFWLGYPCDENDSY
jgi:hypothetical protein